MRRISYGIATAFAAIALLSCEQGGNHSEPSGALPLVFIYGDSVRANYEQPLRKLLQDQAEVWTTGTVNGQSSSRMVANVQGMRPGPFPIPIPTLADYDVICLNAGLWDAVGADPISASSHPPPLSVYEYDANFRTALDTIFEVNPTAKVVIVTTTPRLPLEYIVLSIPWIIEYNQALRLLPADYPNVTICDVYQFVTANSDPTAAQDVYTDGTHFTLEFSHLLAEEIYLAILAVLPATRQH